MRIVHGISVSEIIPALSQRNISTWEVGAANTEQSSGVGSRQLSS